MQGTEVSVEVRSGGSCDNPSYSGGSKRRIMSSRSILAKLARLCQKQNTNKKARVMAEVVVS
jgi:hypothetical protein